MVTKSCSQDTCRDPWTVLHPEGQEPFTSLAEAMQPKYDSFFASVPQVSFNSCMAYQATWNEGPYYPAQSASLGSEYRDPTDNFHPPGDDEIRVPYNKELAGDASQRLARLDEIATSARKLNDFELFLNDNESERVPGPTKPPQTPPPGPLPSNV